MDKMHNEEKRRFHSDTFHRLGHWLMVDLIPVLLLLAIMLWGMSLIPHADAGSTSVPVQSVFRQY